MSDDHEEGGHEHGDHDEGDREWRTTAPMQSYTAGQVRRGFAVTVVGLLLTFGLAVALV